jgi:hypothetical protein
MEQAIGLGVVVVDQKEGGHPDYAFAKFGVKVFRSWADFDRSAPVQVDDLLVHSSDYLGDLLIPPAPSTLEDLRALVLGQGEPEGFASRGRRAANIVLFSSGGEGERAYWVRYYQWLKDAVVNGRVSGFLTLGGDGATWLRTFCTREGVAGQLANAERKGREKAAAKYRRRLQFLDSSAKRR